MKKFILPIMVIALAFTMPLKLKTANKIPLAHNKRFTSVDIGTFSCSAGNFEAYGDPATHAVTAIISNDTGNAASSVSGGYTAPVGDQGTINVYFNYNGPIHYNGHYFE